MFGVFSSEPIGRICLVSIVFFAGWRVDLEDHPVFPNTRQIGNFFLSIFQSLGPSKKGSRSTSTASARDRIKELPHLVDSSATRRLVAVSSIIITPLLAVYTTYINGVMGPYIWPYKWASISVGFFLLITWFLGPPCRKGPDKNHSYQKIPCSFQEKTTCFFPGLF